MSLTPKQERFVAEYLIDLNGKQAAIRAGYSPKTAQEQSSRLLSFVKVQAALSEAQSTLAENAGVTAEKVINELAAIAFTRITDTMRWSPTILSEDGIARSGLALVPSDELTEQASAAIAEVSQGPTGLKLRMHDKRAALLDLGRHLGMFGKGDAPAPSQSLTVNYNTITVEPKSDLSALQSAFSHALARSTAQDA